MFIPEGSSIATFQRLRRHLTSKSTPTFSLIKALKVVRVQQICFLIEPEGYSLTSLLPQISYELPNQDYQSVKATRSRQSEMVLNCCVRVRY
jgi:hypothetical protein